jgi:hypothetical protein
LISKNEVGLRDLEVLSDYFNSIGIELSWEDLLELRQQSWEQAQDRAIRLCAQGDVGYIEPDIEADLGKTLGFIGGAVLGAFFLPGLGLAAGWGAGALIGGSIGQRLTSLFDGGDTRNEAVKSTTDPIYNFSGAGSLIELNAPIPKIYGNRSINPDGGVILRDPGLIYSRVINKQGSRYLQQLFVLSYGPLGEVNQGGLLLDDKPRSDWETNDIITEVSPGTIGQGALGGINHYSQAVNISTNAFVGLAPAIVAELPVIARDPVVISGATNVNLVPAGTITKNAGTANTWDAGARSQSITLAAAYGSYLLVQATGAAGARFALGLSASNTAANLATMDLAVEIDGTNWRVWALNVQQASGPFATTGRVAAIRYYRSEPVGQYQIFIDGVAVNTGTIVLPDTLFADYAIYNLTGAISGLTVDSATHSPATGIAPGYGKRFAISPAALSKLKPAQSYGFGSNVIIVASRSTADNWIEFATPLWIQDELLATTATIPTLGVSRSINILYRAAITTSKAVEQLDLIFLASIYAKNSAGDTIAHAQAFSISITGIGGNYTLGRFIMVNSSEQQLIRMISIANLPEGIYTVRLVPLESADITAPIQSLEDQATTTTIATGVTIGGKAINIIGEFGAVLPVATAQAYIAFPGKVQTSGDRGASIQITHTNEIVYSPSPPTYPGYTIGYLQCLASDRLQNAPATSWDIPKGAIVPNYLHYAKATGSTGTQIFMDLPASDVVPGDRIRVLGVGEWVISSVAGIQIGILTPVALERGQEIVIFRMASSCYFPDHYVDRLINKEDGLGNLVNQDYFIDYKSIVDSRKFCVTNKFFFDAVFAGGTFESWALAAAPSSLLYPTKIEGRYALIPQEKKPPKPFLFNDGNTSKYVEPGVPWSKESTNTLLVKYQNNLGRELQKRVQSTAASTGAAPSVTQTISTQGVTSEAQAIIVGQNSLKSLGLQSRTCQITTDVANGLYVRQGSIIRSQHTVIEYGTQRNGFVVRVDLDGIVLSASVTITDSTRITINHRQSKASEDARPIALLANGKYQVLGLAEPVQPGDIWIIGEIGAEERIWRITSVKPNIKENTVELVGLRWTDEILSSVGMIVS